MVKGAGAGAKACALHEADILRLLQELVCNTGSTYCQGG